MVLNEQEMTLAWFALLVEQKSHEKGSKMWNRYEDLILKFERRLREADNVVYKMSYKLHKYAD